MALLLGLLFPAIKVVQERAKGVQCMTNLRSIGQAAQIHAHDHRGYLPLVGWQFQQNGERANPQGFDDAEQRKYSYYVDGDENRPMPTTAALAASLGIRIRTDSRKNLEADLELEQVRKLFDCPSQEPKLKAGTVGDGRGWNAPACYSSYVFNEAIMAKRNHPWGFPQGNTAKIKRPSIVMLAMDGKPRGAFCVFDMNTSFTMADFRRHVNTVKPGDGPDVLDYTRHQYRANVLFVDGHVESVPLTEEGIATIGISKGVYE